MTNTVNTAEISVREVVGSEICVATSDGDRVYKRLAAALEKEQKIDLSFQGVEFLTTAFLNTAVGRLYGDFSAHKIHHSVTPRDIDADDLALLRQVAKFAKMYYEDPEGIGAILDECEA